MRQVAAVCYWLALLAGASALYDDQAGTFDWYKPYVGHVLTASFHKTKPRLYVSTEQGVVGALNLRDGSIAFRHKLSEDSDALQLTSSLLLDTPPVFVTLAGSSVAAWDHTDGVSKWSAQLPTASSKAKHSQALAALPGDTVRVAVLANGELKVYDAATGAETGSVDLGSQAADQTVGLLQATPSLAAYTFTPGSTSVHVTTLGGGSAASSRMALSSTAAAGPAGFAALSADFSHICVASSGEAQQLTCTSVSAVSDGAVKPTARATLISTSQGWVVASGDEAAPGVVLLKSDAASGALSKVATFPAASSASNALVTAKDEVVAVVESQQEGVVIEYVSCGSGNSISREGPVKGAKSEILAPGVTSPKLKSVFIGSFQKRDQTLGFRALLVWDDERITSVQQGVTVWSRDESQAGVTSALFSDLPPAAAITAAGGQPDFKQQMSQFLHLQLLSAKVQFKLSTKEELSEYLELRAKLSDKQLPTRDARGFRRSLVVATSSGKVAALHNGDGRVIWSRPGPARSPGAAISQRLIQWRTYHDLTHAPLVAVLSQPAAGGVSVSVLDTYSGREVKQLQLGYAIHKLVPIGKVSDGEHAEQFMYLAVEATTGGAAPTVHLLPDVPLTRSHFASHYRSLSFFLDTPTSAPPGSPAFNGFGFDAAAAAQISAGRPAAALPTWSVTFPAPLLSWEAVDPQDPIHTSVKVLGDRSMKYRYLNPNTLVAVTGVPAGVPLSRDDIPTTQAVIYVVDTVTGAILHQQTAPSARGPATCTITGNLAVVQLWDAASSRFTITSLELYDASERQFSVLDHMFNPNSTQPQSSYHPPPLEVLTASFFTRTPAKSLSTSRTRAGITSKMLLFLTHTDQVFALDMRFVDPRRPHRAKLTPEEQEERLVPYQDTLPLAPTAFASYNKQVLGLKRVIAAPSRLESTSLLFSHGLDLQYTRVAPAKGFDSLDDDFSYGLLVVALIMLLVSSAMMHVFTKKSMLKAKWQ